MNESNSNCEMVLSMNMCVERWLGNVYSFALNTNKILTPTLDLIQPSVNWFQNRHKIFASFLSLRMGSKVVNLILPMLTIWNQLGMYCSWWNYIEETTSFLSALEAAG